MSEDHVESSITIEDPNNSSGVVVSEHYEAEAPENSPQDLICDEAPGNPRQPLREALVATAAKFLQTSKVANSDASTKQLFLRKKGLTPLELRDAFTRAGLSYEVGVDTENVTACPTTVPPWQLPPSVHYPRPGAMQVAYTPWGRATLLWQQLKEFCQLVLFVTGAAYGAHYLYQHVIRPWLTGRRPPEPVELQMARLQAAVADSLVQLKSSVVALQYAVQGYTAAAKGCPSCGSDSSSFSSSPPLGQQLQQVKAEITSLKSLMLNRRNFTPTPSLAPSIPAWQRSNGNNDGGETVTSVTRASVTSSSAASLTGRNGTFDVARSSEDAVTSDAKSSAPSSSKNSVFNAVEKENSNGGLISVTGCTKDSIPNNCKPSVTSSNSLEISYSSENIQPPHDDESHASNTSNNTTSSFSATSDVIVSIPDRPDRTSSGDSIVFSDALDGSVVNGIASNDDL